MTHRQLHHQSPPQDSWQLTKARNLENPEQLQVVSLFQATQLASASSRMRVTLSSPYCFIGLGREVPRLPVSLGDFLKPLPCSLPEFRLPSKMKITTQNTRSCCCVLLFGNTSFSQQNHLFFLVCSYLCLLSHCKIWVLAYQIAMWD